MNKLNHLAEFQKVIQQYEISETSRQILDKTKLVLLVAPSASGRNTIINRLLDKGEYYFVISDTTREPRVNNGLLEQNGREYWFREEDDLLEDLKQGKFLEAEILHGQQVSGISIRELKKAYDTKKVPITDVDIGGVHTIMQAKKDTIAILVLPPSFREWQHRMTNRGELEAGEYKRRMQTAARIFRHALGDNELIYVINDDVDQAAEAVHAITSTGHVDQQRQKEAHKLIGELLAETEQTIQELRG